MNQDSRNPNLPPEESLPNAWIAALRTLPSERRGPPGEMDDEVMAMAASQMARIRQRRRLRYLGPALAAAASLALAWVWLSHRPSDSGLTSAPKAEDPYAVILREVSQVFPTQIKAIFTGEGELRIALAEEEAAEPGQAVVLEISGEGEPTTVITYVGQTVEIGRHQVTVHRDQNGGIVVESPGMADPGTNSPAPLQIKARPIS